MSERSIGVTLLGCGVVGGGVLNILTQQRDLLRQRTGLTFDIRHVVVRDIEKHAATFGANLPLTTDAERAIDDPATQIVIELIGGMTAAASHIERALKHGKPVVTANKSLLSARGSALFALARKLDTCIAFEASCGGGVPIVESLMKGLLANRIDALVGIVNGTCNVILTRMTRNGWSYGEALKEAQRLGFAEADPTLDVSGRDAAQKLALLASLAFNVGVSEGDIHVEGIDTIQPTDIQFARDLGYVIKLLAIAERVAEKVSLRVHPTLVHKDDVLAEVGGSFNAISVYGHALGHALFYGRGAGQMPTASAVVSDLLGVALGTTPLAFKQLRIFPDTTPRASVLPFHELQSRYYLRLLVKDQPGVMGQVSQILGNNRISLSAILQRETDDGQNVPIVITTHRATEGPMRKALDQINALPTITPPTVCLRIIDQPKEFAGG
ncbi:MAG TPA: homoserine dehydrogenase [Tepidisphaeraceae bacterium]|nr:homoserine dehydrogenase [Tepidisphaeraceae bacterium]